MARNVHSEHDSDVAVACGVVANRRVFFLEILLVPVQFLGSKAKGRIVPLVEADDRKTIGAIGRLSPTGLGKKRDEQEEARHGSPLFQCVGW